MRWSIEELLYGIKIASNCEFKFWYRLTHFFPAAWRIIKVICRWIVSGYCWATIWDLDRYLMNVAIIRLKLFKKANFDGYPFEFESKHDWDKMIDRLINGFEVMRDQSIYDEGVKSLDYSLKVDEKGYYNFEVDDSEQSLIKSAGKKQADYDEETVTLFIKYFSYLWG